MEQEIGKMEKNKVPSTGKSFMIVDILGLGKEDLEKQNGEITDEGPSIGEKTKENVGDNDHHFKDNDNTDDDQSKLQTILLVVI